MYRYIIFRSRHKNVTSLIPATCINVYSLQNSIESRIPAITSITSSGRVQFSHYMVVSRATQLGDPRTTSLARYRRGSPEARHSRHQAAKLLLLALHGV